MIIDFHTHAFPDRIAGATIDVLSKKGNISAHSDGTAAGLLSALGKAGVDVAVNLPVLTKPTQFDGALRFAKELNERSYTGPRIISFGGIHPGEEDVDGRLLELKNAGILGIKLHPDYQGTYFDDPAYVRIIERAKSLGLIVITHAGYDFAYPDQPIKCTPDRVLRLLDKIGGYDKLVLAHIGGNDFYGEVYFALAGCEVYLDTAFNLRNVPEDTFKRILDKHGDDKVLFGSDSPWRDIGEEVGILKSYNLGKETEEKIFSKNAIKLLGI